jgi:2-amino-4-hydroxy-6-hydroxymethyldihydropteridine diphosphokinase
MMQTNIDQTAARVKAFIGVGSNLSDPILQVQRAIREIDEIAETTLVNVSSLYESAPIGFAGQNAFINAVVEVETALTPQQLMRALLDIEAWHHRVRAEKNGPRTLDLDILLFSDRQLDSEDVTLPHARAHERAFVLLPLLELAPDIFIPGRGLARQFLPAVQHQQIQRLYDPANVTGAIR